MMSAFEEVGTSTGAVAELGTPAGSWKHEQLEENGSWFGRLGPEPWSAAVPAAVAQHPCEAAASTQAGAVGLSNRMKTQCADSSGKSSASAAASVSLAIRVLIMAWTFVSRHTR